MTVTEANVDKVSLNTVFPIALGALTCRESASQGFSKTSGPECLRCLHFLSNNSVADTRHRKCQIVFAFLKRPAFAYSPMVNMLKMVPTTAMRRIVPSWSKKSLLGMK